MLFDDTALIALFDTHEAVWELWQAADEGRITILVPAAAVAAANAHLRTSDRAWESILGSHAVLALDLTASRALAASRYGRDVVIGQVSAEARDTDATIITSRRGEYDDLLRVIRF